MRDSMEDQLLDLQRAEPSQDLKRRTLEAAGRAMQEERTTSAAVKTSNSIPWRFWLAWATAMLLVLAGEISNMRILATWSAPARQIIQPAPEELQLLQEIGLDTDAADWSRVLSSARSDVRTRDAESLLEHNEIRRLIRRES